MSCCRKWRQQITETVYGELAGSRRNELEAHLETCPRCAAELASLTATAALVAAELPARPREGELDVWSRIQPRLDDLDRQRKPAGRLSLTYPAAALVAAVLVVLGLGLGSVLRPGARQDAVSPPIVASQPDTGAVELARYLERATPLLLAVANRRTGAGAAASFGSGAERRLAASLAAKAARLGEQLDERGKRRQRALVGDLERVFLQLANLAEGDYHHGISMVQQTIENRALVFQLSVEEMRRLGAPEA